MIEDKGSGARVGVQVGGDLADFLLPARLGWNSNVGSSFALAPAAPRGVKWLSQASRGLGALMRALFLLMQGIVASQEQNGRSFAATKGSSSSSSSRYADSQHSCRNATALDKPSRA